MTAIRLMENFRAVFYAPYYAMLTLGLAADEGVDVELVTSDTPGDAVPLLLNGTIDLTWGGPMRVMLAHDRDPDSPLVCFGEMVSHDPFFLIGRHKPFTLADLAHLRFASVAEVPTPWVCLQHDLREAGIDPSAITRIADRTMAENYAALKRGAIDVMQAFEPFASMAEADGASEVLYAASARGPTVYTGFIATRDAIAKRRDVFAAMTRAVARMEQWLYAHSPGELAEAAAPYFPHVSNDLLTRSLARYRTAGLWAREPAMSRAGFERLGQSFLSGGSLSRPSVYETCVQPGL